MDPTAGKNRNTQPLAGEVFERLEIEPGMADIVRYLGYPKGASPPPRVAQSIEPIIEKVKPLLKPRGAYSLYRVEARTPRSLTLGGAVLEGDIGEFLGGVERVAVFVATVGDDIARRAREAWDRDDPLAGWALDALGSWAAEAAADALTVQLGLQLNAGEAMTLRFSPGYCGMDLEQQRALFRLVQAGAVGVELLPTFLMKPLKSISGVIGMGPKEAVDAGRSTCERCGQVHCPMRR
jgi:hypothetical protein